MLIFPVPSMVMSFPVMVIVPSFFREILALPVVSVMESPALTAKFCPALIASFLPISDALPPDTLIVWSAPTVRSAAPPTLTLCPAPILRLLTRTNPDALRPSNLDDLRGAYRNRLGGPYGVLTRGTNCVRFRQGNGRHLRAVDGVRPRACDCHIFTDASPSPTDAP